MKLIRNIALGISALILVGLTLIYATGNSMLLTMGWALAFGGPSLPFDANDTAPAPVYSDSANWAALPQPQRPRGRNSSGHRRFRHSGQRAG